MYIQIFSITQLDFQSMGELKLSTVRSMTLRHVVFSSLLHSTQTLVFPKTEIAFERQKLKLKLSAFVV